MTTTTATFTANAIAEPSILAANTYFWTPGFAADNRRRNEERNQSTVANYFQAIGFQVERSGDNVIAVTDDAKLGHIEVYFSYSESCNNVYKSLSVTRNGNKSNITTIRKIANNN